MVVCITLTDEKWLDVSTQALVSKDAFEKTLATIISNNHVNHNNIQKVHIILPDCLTIEQRHIIHKYSTSYRLTTETKVNIHNKRQIHIYIVKDYVQELLHNYVSDTESFDYSSESDGDSDSGSDGGSDKNADNEPTVHVYQNTHHVHDANDTPVVKTKDIASETKSESQTTPTKTHYVNDPEDTFNYSWFMCGVIYGLVCGICISEFIHCYRV